MMQLIFFAVSILVLFSGHILFWLFLIKLFQISSFEGRLIAALIILFVFLSTVAASYLIHKWDNIFTRWYYIIAGFWIGLLANFSLMMIVILLLRFLGWSFDYSFPLFALKFIFLVGAIALSLFGLYKAWVPKVTSYEVVIKDLPDSWNNKVVVQISDVHLGPVYRERSFARLLKKVQELNPEAVFITGDLFDGMESDFSWLNHPFTKMNVPRGIYYSFGNHDLYLGFNRAMELLKNNPVIILDNKMRVVDGLQIIGVNYSFNKDFDLEEAILEQVGYSKDKASILLFHEPKNIELAKKAEIDLQLSGHTHNGQLFPFNYLAKLAYKGYGHGLFNDGDFSLIVNRGAGTWGPPMRTSGQSEIVKIILKKK
ncbi:MAG: metallophosphoesterase [Candidatus Falkowbacteria bacterium]